MLKGPSKEQLDKIFKKLLEKPYHIPKTIIIIMIDDNEDELIEKLDSYFECFKSYDTDGDDKLSVSELKEAAKKFCKDLTDEDIKEMMKEYDENGDNYLQFHEFVGMMEKNYENEAEIMFNFMDQGKKGFLTKDDLRLFLEEIGEEVTEANVSSLMTYADKNNDGGISFEEFKEILFNS